MNRRDIIPKITGQAVYTYDINPSHVGVDKFLYLGLILSPYPSAKITSIDTSKADAAGYVTLTSKDIPPYGKWSNGRRETVLASDKVRYAGEPVVAVAAPSLDEVEDAIDLVKIAYEPTKYVADPEEALRAGAPQLFAEGNNPSDILNGPQASGEDLFAQPSHVSSGDVDTALAQADAVVTVTLNTQIVQHFAFEPKGEVAVWENGTLVIYSSNQWVHQDMYAVAQYLGIPMDQIVVRTALGLTGGAVLGMALGNKVLANGIAIAAIMAKKAGQAVMYGPTRKDEALSTHQRFPLRGYFTVGGTKEGKFTAMKALLYANAGAYGPSAGSDSVADMLNLYVVPNIHIDLINANTNAYHFQQQMRDVGASQSHFMMETVVDMLAQKLNIDPLKFRMDNMRTQATAIDPSKSLPYTSFGQPAIANKATAAFDWSSKWKGWGTPAGSNGPIKTGVGVTIMNTSRGLVSPPVSGQIQVNPNGSVVVYTGFTDHGAGGNTTLIIEAAELLGLTSFDNVEMIQSDTKYTSDTGITAGSRTTRNGGLAFIEAVKDLKKQWFPIVSAKLGVSDPTTLTFGDNKIFVQGNPGQSISFKDAAALLKAPITGYGRFLVPTTYSYRQAGTKFIELELDTETGDVHVTNYVTGNDIGQIIFARGAESQARGGFFMGYGEALLEELIIDPTTGSYLNPNFHDYRIATQLDAPDQVIPVWEQAGDPVAPFGAKGLGEHVLIGVSPTIANALSNALGGYRFTKLPITRQDIVEGIRWAKQNGKI